MVFIGLFAPNFLASFYFEPHYRLLRQKHENSHSDDLLQLHQKVAPQRLPFFLVSLSAQLSRPHHDC